MQRGTARYFPHRVAQRGLPRFSSLQCRHHPRQLLCRCRIARRWFFSARLSGDRCTSEYFTQISPLASRPLGFVRSVIQSGFAADAERA